MATRVEQFWDEIPKHLHEHPLVVYIASLIEHRTPVKPEAHVRLKADLDRLLHREAV